MLLLCLSACGNQRADRPRFVPRFNITAGTDEHVTRVIYYADRLELRGMCFLDWTSISSTNLPAMLILPEPGILLNMMEERRRNYTGVGASLEAHARFAAHIRLPAQDCPPGLALAGAWGFLRLLG
jgi:hypothetical protein